MCIEGCISTIMTYCGELQCTGGVIVYHEQ